MKIKNLYIRGQKTVPFEVRMNNGRTVFRSKKPWTLACGASFLLISGFALLVTLITGCETVPVKKEPSKITYRAAVPLVKIKKVVVDAGHGGYDPGAIGRTGLKEKDVNLDIAKRLSNLLRSEGVKVTLTRSSDTFVSLGKRVRLANDSGADLFVSIHSNASRTRSLCGFETYYVSHGVNDSKRAAYAARNVD
ncbi:MAG: N-acetylmuramoyl-L-alanine amidase, partial [Candidatus Omnitrophica bacterium]|nr:N-acetylmuramoyl-L-alanine amidase [Candidatus Omnitrophota bacterium]